jgi:hypothetical protein
MNVYLKNLGKVPKDYKCSCCVIQGLQLMHKYTFCVSNVELLCKHCVAKNTKKPLVKVLRCDQVGSYVPSVPTFDGTYWSFTGATSSSCLWYRYLPVRKDEPMDSIKKRVAFELERSLENIKYCMEQNLPCPRSTSSWESDIEACLEFKRIVGI